MARGRKGRITVKVGGPPKSDPPLSKKTRDTFSFEAGVTGKLPTKPIQIEPEVKLKYKREVEKEYASKKLTKKK